MKNHLITVAIAASLAFVFNPVYADCKNITLTAPGNLFSSDCYKSGVLYSLEKSGQYPDVFSAKKYIFPNLPAYIPNTVCYVSPKEGFSATINDNPVIITTISAWTNDTKPVLFSMFDSSYYKDNLGAVITQISVFDLKGKFNGNIYSRDVVDLSHFTSGFSIEQDTIIGGTKVFSGAMGSFRIESNGITNPSVSVPIDVLEGAICTGGN